MCDGILDNLYWGFTFGALGYLIANVLTEPGEILSKWPNIVKWVTRSGDSPRDWGGWQYWIHKITWNCGKCISGNLALWWLAFTQTETSFQGQDLEVVVFSILTAYVLEKKI